MQTRPRTGFGKAALILFILLPLVPIAFNIIVGMSGSATWARLSMVLAPFILLGLLCGLLAFIFGIVGWKSPAGKVAAIGVPCLGILCIPGLFLLMFIPVTHAVKISHAEQSKVQDLIIHQAYPLDSLEGLITKGEAEIDEAVFSTAMGL
ncbi:MAG TPA: hypothetical protein PK052_11645 [Anaerohalosphaeraceae bacterium]|nr:hypothetical protein [Phycisphaerae bacterium]HOK96916.1 hypothetical protein [Anaerohalosphaeraceae bacterium]HOL32620.1 hypothetical protein [Anaerohalosphaeraceae bacterium]HOM77090.1 hypothetical protein [Anaerohalosphaeraceae bacterium]HPC64942.1 hypothetical protein [Anaerohalosphaeraceae bacterium]